MKYENRIPGLLEVYNVQLGQRGNAVLNNVTGKYESPQEGPTRTGSIALEIAKKCSEQFISAFEDGIPAKLVKDLVTSMREAGDHDTRNQLLHSESNISIIPIITNESDVSEGYEHPSLNAEQIPELLRMSKKITSLNLTQRATQY